MVRAEVSTSDAWAPIPTRSNRPTTASGVALALFVTNATPLPAARMAAMASAADGIASSPR